MKNNLFQRGAQGKHAAAKELNALIKENMVSQVYDCTRIKVFTRDHHLREGIGVIGTLTMTEEFENFEFREKIVERWTRNPVVWQGAYINVHRDKEGQYQVFLKKMELNKNFNALRVTAAICTELRTAKKILGL